jgi:serine/threonine protein kinase
MIEINQDIKIIENINQGAEASTYKCIRNKNNIEQVLLAKIYRDPNNYEQAINEAKLLAKINHPNILKYIDHLYTHDSCLCLLFEYIDGVTLDQYIKRREHINEDQILFIYHTIISTLTFVHQKGIIHGDVKPANIMISQDNTIKLIDFGVSRKSNDDQSNQYMAGSINYLDPYCFQNKLRPDENADLFAAALMLFEMATKSKLFSGIIWHEVIEQYENYSGIEESELEIIPFSMIRDILKDTLKLRPEDRITRIPRKITTVNLNQIDITDKTIRNIYSIKKTHKTKKLIISTILASLVILTLAFIYINKQNNKIIPILNVTYNSNIARYGLAKYESYTNSTYSNEFCDNLYIGYLSNLTIIKDRNQKTSLQTNLIKLIDQLKPFCDQARYFKLDQLISNNLNNTKFIIDNAQKAEPESMWISYRDIKDINQNHQLIKMIGDNNPDFVFTETEINDEGKCSDLIEMLYVDNLFNISGAKNQYPRFNMKYLLLPKELVKSHLFQFKGTHNNQTLIEMNHPRAIQSVYWCYGEFENGKKTINFGKPVKL